MKTQRTFITLTLAWIVMCSTVLSQPLDIAEKGEVAKGQNGMATTAHPLASKAAIEMLQKGGNAVDAAVAAAFAIGVVESDGSGLGGGGGMLIYLAKSKQPVYINYYQQASGRINEVSYNPQSDSRSAKAILVPGTVAGLTLALEKHGTLALAVVLEPAIRYAEQGYPVDQTLAQIILDNVEFLQKYPSTSEIFLRDGFPLVEGDTLRQLDLARTLKAVAAQGRGGFYKGPIAEALAKGVQENGGMLTIEDLGNYQAQISKPVFGSYRGYDIIAAAPPQSGVSIIQALNILENENLAKLGHYSTSADALHVMAEATRRMYADRTAFLDDPRLGHVPVNGLASKEYGRKRYDDINMAMVVPSEYRKTKAGNPLPFDEIEMGSSSRAPEKEEKTTIEADDSDNNDGNSRSAKSEDDIFDRWGGKKKQPAKKPAANSSKQEKEERPEIEGKEGIQQSSSMRLLPDREAMPGRSMASVRRAEEKQAEGGHTTHLSVMDRDGNVVTMTQTLGTFFGSGLTVEGVLLNCGMANFSTTLSINNIGPNRQPRSSIAPTILMKNGKPFLSVGSPGAARIEATIVELIVNIVDYGMDAGAANQAPRFFCQKNDEYLHLESRISESVQEGLRKKGHTLRVYGEYDLFFGGAQLIMFDQNTGIMYGSADLRRGGVAIGY